MTCKCGKHAHDPGCDRREHSASSLTVPLPAFYEERIRLLEAELQQAQERAQLYETVLRNIANEYWNAGRDVPISLMEYAQSALNVTADRPL